jgi:hypothetical protein
LNKGGVAGGRAQVSGLFPYNGMLKHARRYFLNTILA